MKILFGAWLLYNIVMFAFALYLVVFGIRTYRIRKGMAIFFIVMGMFGIFRIINQLIIH